MKERQCNAAALRAASRRTSQFYEEALAPSGLRGTQFSLLSRIDAAAAVPLNELADRLSIDRSTLGHTLRRLQRDGWIALGSDPRDRRARAVPLTRKGKAKLVATFPLWAKPHARFETAFGARRAARLRKLLAQVE